MVRAELARVEHVNLGGAHPVGAVELQACIEARDDRRLLDRHVLVIGLEGGKLADEEFGLGLLLRILGGVAGPVVVNLMIIKRDNPGRSGMGRLKVRVRPVEGVTVPVIPERDDLGTVVLAHGLE